MHRFASLLTTFAITLGAAVPASALSDCEVGDRTPAQLAEARAILNSVPLIDGHNDLPWALLDRFSNRLSEVDLRQDQSGGDRPLHTDIPRLRSGGVGAQFWSVYVPVELARDEATRQVLEQIDVVYRLAEHYPDTFEIALTAADVEKVHKAGKIASLIGMEGGHSIANSLAVLRQMFNLGARYMTVTHWQNTDWADSATDDPEHDGLTEFGLEVIREMNRLGMIVDLSHVSEKTMSDVFSIAEAPVIFSHSSARDATPHPRNVPASMFPSITENGGVVMVTFVTSFVSEELRQYNARKAAEQTRLESVFIGSPEQVSAAMESWEIAHPAPRVTVEHVADHIDALRDELGIDYIGIGSDYDGIRATPVGLESVACFPVLLAELLDRGYSTADLEKMSGLNVLRVMREVEATASRLQQQGPSSDVIYAAPSR